MTHCSNQRKHNPEVREIPYWGLRGQNPILGPIYSSEILIPCPWPETLRIPGRTLPTAGRCRRIKLTQCGPLGLLDKEPVPGLRELRPYFPNAAPPRRSSNASDDKDNSNETITSTDSTEKKEKGKGKGKGKGKNEKGGGKKKGKK